MSIAERVTFETTLAVRDACLSLHVQRAARAVARRFDEAFRPAGLTSGQFSLLNALNRPGPPNLGAVAALMAMDRTTLTAALKPLERRGLVEASRNPRDRRSRLLALTEAGRGALAAALPIWTRTHAALEAERPETDPDRLRRDLAWLSLAPTKPAP